MDRRVSSPYQHLNQKVKYVTTTAGYVNYRLTNQFNDAVGDYQGQ